MAFNPLTQTSLPVLPITSKKILLQLVSTITPVLETLKSISVQVHIEEFYSIHPTEVDSVQIQSISERAKLKCSISHKISQ